MPLPLVMIWKTLTGWCSQQISASRASAAGCRRWVKLLPHFGQPLLGCPGVEACRNFIWRASSHFQAWRAGLRVWVCLQFIRMAQQFPRSIKWFDRGEGIVIQKGWWCWSSDEELLTLLKQHHLQWLGPIGNWLRHWQAEGQIPSWPFDCACNAAGGWGLCRACSRAGHQGQQRRQFQVVLWFNACMRISTLMRRETLSPWKKQLTEARRHLRKKSGKNTWRKGLMRSTRLNLHSTYNKFYFELFAVRVRFVWFWKAVLSLWPDNLLAPGEKSKTRWKQASARVEAAEEEVVVEEEVAPPGAPGRGKLPFKRKRPPPVKSELGEDEEDEGREKYECDNPNEQEEPRDEPMGSPVHDPG